MCRQPQHGRFRSARRGRKRVPQHVPTRVPTRVLRRVSKRARGVRVAYRMVLLGMCTEASFNARLATRSRSARSSLGPR
eukprot:11162335-Lingulodinium_polyedra.AAC.1